MHFFRSDAPPEEIAARRRAGFLRLSKLYHDRFPETLRLTALRRSLGSKKKCPICRVVIAASQPDKAAATGFVNYHI